MNQRKLIFFLFFLFLAFAFLILKKSPSENILSYEVCNSDNKQLTPLSVVNGEKNISSIRFFVRVKNTGKKPLYCNIDSANPLELKESLTPPSKTVSVGSSVVWISDFIQTKDLESDEPITFGVSVSCWMNNGTEVKKVGEKKGEVSLLISSEEVTDLPHVFICGDGVCEYQENCPEDCEFGSFQPTVIVSPITYIPSVFEGTFGPMSTGAKLTSDVSVIVPTWQIKRTELEWKNPPGTNINTSNVGCEMINRSDTTQNYKCTLTITPTMNTEEDVYLVVYAVNEIGGQDRRIWGHFKFNGQPFPDL